MEKGELSQSLRPCKAVSYAATMTKSVEQHINAEVHINNQPLCIPVSLFISVLNRTEL